MSILRIRVSPFVASLCLLRCWYSVFAFDLRYIASDKIDAVSRSSDVKHTMATVTDVSTFDYVCFVTGYTHRLMSPERNGDMKKMIEREIYLEEHETLTAGNLFVCVYDKSWGSGHYNDSKEDVTIETVRQVFDYTKEIDGVIIFRINAIGMAMQMVGILSRLRYCNCMNYDTLEDVKIHSDGTTKVLVMHFGTESG